MTFLTGDVHCVADRLGVGRTGGGALGGRAVLGVVLDHFGVDDFLAAV